jgi:outer membrane receptor for ferrienterochelin and colicins
MRYLAERGARALAVALALGATPAGARAGDAPMEIADVDLETLLDLTVVAASLHEQRSSESAASVFVLTGEDIRRHDFRTLQDVLRSVPGLFAYRDDPFPMIGVRGLGLPGDYTTRLLVLIDGHAINNSLAIGQSYLGHDLPVPLSTVERIEVIKGPVGSVYGPTAFLGVVNVVTTRAGKARSSVWAGSEAAQGRGLPGTGGVQWAARAHDVDILVAAEGWRTDGYTFTFPELVTATDRPPPPGGRVAGAASADAGTLYGRASWRDLKLVAACNEWSTGLPTAPFSTQLLDKTNRLENRTCYAQLAFERPVAPGATISARAAYDDFRFGDTLSYAPPPESYGLFRDVGRDRWFSGDARLSWQLSPATFVLAGVGAERHATLQHSWAVALPTVPADPEHGVGVGEIKKEWVSLLAYALAEHKVTEHVQLHAGVTAFRHELFGSRFTPKAAAIWTPTRSDVVKAVLSEGFRAPTASEAYFEDGTAYVANPALRPETVRSLELIVEHRFERNMGLTLSLFQNDYGDLIRFVSVPAPGLGRAPDPNQPSDFRSTAENVARLRTRGAELGVNVSWGDTLRAWGGLSAQENDEPGFANFPALTGNFSLSTRAPWRPLSLSLHGAFGAARTKFQTTTSDAARDEIGPFLVLGAAALLDVPGARGLSLALSVENLLDAHAPSPAESVFVPITELAEPPRAARLLVRWSFD